MRPFIVILILFAMPSLAFAQQPKKTVFEKAGLSPQDYRVLTPKEADKVRGGWVNPEDDSVFQAFGGKWSSKDFTPLTREEADKIRGGYQPGHQNPHWHQQRRMMYQSIIRQTNRR